MIAYTPKEHYTLDDLVEIVALLRSPDGCPWDKEQTHESIRTDLIEETYEVIEAIQTKNTPLLREELGDMLLQVVFHSQIERECGHFTLDDVIQEVSDKMVTRHAHVFGNVTANTTSEALDSWDKIKSKTKNQTTTTEKLNAVAMTLPALMRAEKVYKRANKSPLPVCDKMADIDEATNALQTLGETDDKDALSTSLGKILFALSAFAQTHDIDLEQCLTDTTNEFIATYTEEEGENAS